jgi:hypothetical protein
LNKFLFLVKAAILNGGRSEQKITTLDKDLARNISFMTIFNSILHVVSEKKIFEISANQRLLWPLPAILDNRSEQKVKTIDQNLVRNISAKYGSNPPSGS